MSRPEAPDLDCTRARDALLEAEPHELRPGAPGALGRHLAACPLCRAQALRIVEATGALATRVASPPPLDVETVVHAARPPSRRGRLLRAGLPLAAAAVLATVLFVPREAGDDPLPGPPAAQQRPAAVATPVATPVAEFTPPPDRNAVVLQTRNPDITVIWLYGEGP